MPSEELFQEGEDVSRCMKLCKWCCVVRNVARLQVAPWAEEADVAQKSKGSARCRNSGPCCSKRELLRDFPEGSDNGQMYSLERSFWQSCKGRFEQRQDRGQRNLENK